MYHLNFSPNSSGLVVFVLYPYGGGTLVDPLRPSTGGAGGGGRGGQGEGKVVLGGGGATSCILSELQGRGRENHHLSLLGRAHA